MGSDFNDDLADPQPYSQIISHVMFYLPCYEEASNIKL